MDKAPVDGCGSTRNPPQGEATQGQVRCGATLQDALRLLRAERVRQGLSLADIQDRTGIERPNLSRLENEGSSNPTVATLTRYAEALGKRLVIVLADR